MTIRFCSLSSGSSGNCQYIEANGTRLLIDAGLSGKKIEGLLDQIEVDPNSLDGILVTHEHTDHVKGVGILSRRYDLPVYANNQTWLGMEDKIGNIGSKNIKVFQSELDLEINNLNIYPIKTYHDAREPVGYIFYYKNKKISIITDTGFIDKHMEDKIKGSDLYLIESNHDIRMLKEGSYPRSLKERVLSAKGHLSNVAAGETLANIVQARGEVVLLGHLSKDNNLPRLAYDTVATILSDKGLVLGSDLNLGLAPRDGISNIFRSK